MTHQKLLIRHLRRTRDLSMDAVSVQTGIDISTLSRIERGLIPGTVPQRHALAGYFGRSVDELFSEVTAEVA